MKKWTEGNGLAHMLSTFPSSIISSIFVHPRIVFPWRAHWEEQGSQVVSKYLMFLHKFYKDNYHHMRYQRHNIHITKKASVGQIQLHRTLKLCSLLCWDEVQLSTLHLRHLLVKRTLAWWTNVHKPTESLLYIYATPQTNPGGLVCHRSRGLLQFDTRLKTGFHLAHPLILNIWCKASDPSGHY